MTKTDAVDIVILECLLPFYETKQAIKSKFLWSKYICRYPLRLDQKALVRKLVKLDKAGYVKRHLLDDFDTTGYWQITKAGIALYQLADFSHAVDVT